MRTATAETQFAGIGRATCPLYHVVANRIASRIVAELPDTSAASCMLVSRIGAPMDQAAVVDVIIAAVPNDRIRARVDEVVHHELARFEPLRDELMAGLISLA